MATQVSRVLGGEIAERDVVGGRVVAEVLAPGLLRIDDAARTRILVNVREHYIVSRPVAGPTLAGMRAECAFCGKGVGITKTETMLPHGPKADRCGGSGLTEAEAKVKRADLDALSEAEAATA